MSEEDQRQTIIKLLTTAEKLAQDLSEPVLSYLIERAIDEARAGISPLKGQAPYFRDSSLLRQAHGQNGLTKRNKKGGQFMAVKKSKNKFKGVRREKAS
jgi:hypothetical protein